MGGKLIRVKADIYQRLCEEKKVDTFNNIIEQLLDFVDEYDEIKELIQADIDLKNHQNIIEFESIDDFRNYFKD